MSTPSFFASEIHVNTTTANNQTFPVVAALANGQFVVTWADASQSGGDPSGTAVRAQRYHADGTHAGGEFIVNQTISGNQFDPAVASLSDGRFVVAWVDDSALAGDTSLRAIRAQIYNLDGSRAGGEFLVNTTTGNNQDSPAIAALVGGGFVVTWTHRFGADDLDVRGRAFNSAGAPLGNDFAVDETGLATNEDESAVVALANGNYAVVWTDEGGGGETDGSGTHVRAAIFSGNGGVIVPEFIVNTTTVGDQTLPAIARLSDGNFIVTWTSEDDDLGGVRGRVFTQNGVALGADFVVDNEQELEFAPSVTALANGAYAVAWQNDDGDLETDGSGSHVRAEVLAGAAGTSLSDEFVVNTTTQEFQADVTLATLADGRVVATWADFGDNSGDPASSIRAQIFDPRTEGVHLVGSGMNDEWVGTAFADTMAGNGGTDRLDGGGGDDALAGGAESDLLKGSGGSDMLEGGLGDDFILGGSGTDTAVFAGSRSNYAVNLRLDGGVDVVDQRAGQPFGTDLTDAERLSFADGVFAPVASLGDVVWRHDEGSVAVADRHLAVVSTGFQVVGTGDFDRDGDADILWRGNAGEVVTWEMEGGALVTNHNLPQVGNSFQIAGTGDFDRDGDADILWRGSAGEVVTWEMEHGALITNHNLPTVSPSFQIAGTGDFDHDGDADILWRGSAGEVVTWEMQDGQLLTTHNLPAVSTNFQIAGTGDFDHDGDADILWRGADGAVVTWEMEGGSLLTNHNLAQVSTNFAIVGTQDFDHDGDADILWRGSDGAVVNWEMEGGNLVVNHNLGVVANAWDIRATGAFDLA